jgi:hypothetical protein
MRSMVYVTSAEGERFAPVTHLPGICELGHDLLACGIVGTGTNQTVIGWGDRGVNPAEGRLVHIVEGDLLIAHTEELATIAGLVAVCRSQSQGPLPRQVGVGLGGLLGHHQQRETDYREQTDPPRQSVEYTRRHVCPSLSLLRAYLSNQAVTQRTTSYVPKKFAGLAPLT